MNWNVITAAALVFTLATALPAASGPEMVDLEAADVLCRPGDDVVLRAKLEESGIRGQDIEKATIQFRLDGQVLGASKTDDDGVAVYRIKAPQAGDHRVKVVYEGDTDYLRAEFNALLCVRPATEPVLVLDIDWTISMTNNLNTAIGSSDSPPLKDAAEVVARLGKKYTLAYVTARARQLRKRTLSWLERYDFPRGPSFFLNPKEFPTYNEAKYKKAVLTPLKDIFPAMKLGFGNKESDVEAYKAVNMVSVLITDRVIPGALCVKQWGDVEQALAGAAKTR